MEFMIMSKPTIRLAVSSEHLFIACLGIYFNSPINSKPSALTPHPGPQLSVCQQVKATHKRSTLQPEKTRLLRLRDAATQDEVT